MIGLSQCWCELAMLCRLMYSETAYTKEVKVVTRHGVAGNAFNPPVGRICVSRGALINFSGINRGRRQIFVLSIHV